MYRVADISVLHNTSVLDSQPEVNRRNVPSAIQAFQVALCADPDDQLSWVRLGETYSKAGRASAFKALHHAQ